MLEIIPAPIILTDTDTPIPGLSILNQKPAKILKKQRPIAFIKMDSSLLNIHQFKNKY